MSDDNTRAAAKLRKLGEKVREGWARLHPVSEKQLAAVRAAVRQQWQQEHGSKSRVQSQRTAKQTQAAQDQTSAQAESKKTKRQSRSKDHGHSH